MLTKCVPHFLCVSFSAFFVIKAIDLFCHNVTVAIMELSLYQTAVPCLLLILYFVYSQVASTKNSFSKKVNI